MVLSILSVAKVLPSPQRKDEPREIHLEAPLKEKEFCIKVVHYVGADKLIARIEMLDLHLFAASYLEVAETVQIVQSCVSHVIGDLASARLGWIQGVTNPQGTMASNRSDASLSQEHQGQTGRLLVRM